ncbi:DUF6285 domain-containing protein [Minwuia thermotolerans]|uniref:DUF6285 domain-containing protein n=1 Tax=Minwuia thermotolerans TaxID=2056226 RepID=A0A2M9FVF5_9PROT|nr:DUF6285 domain-containing protein [Minwuia thermotolerans]PJK27462.1 hypothetical protein CVT23_21295 [Minwuia thermotolerans]
MRQDQPAAHDLVGTVREYLEGLAGKLDDEHRFDLRVATHLLGIVERELRDRPDFEDDECAALRDLTGAKEGEDAIDALCRALRAGALDNRWDEALAAVNRTVELKMKVVRPAALAPADKGEKNR